MSYKVPSPNELHQLLIAFWKALFPLSGVGSRFSYHWKRLRAYAFGGSDLHEHISVAQDDVMPDTALGATLVRWSNIVKVIPKGATGARKTNGLRVFGTAASPVPFGQVLTHAPTGFSYQVNEAGAVIGAGGSVDVDVSAISTGAATRLLAGETLTFVSTPAGLKANAKIVLDLDEDGFDSEQESALSSRMLQRLGDAGAGGTAADFVQWALQVTGVDFAYAYPNRAGFGTMDVAALHTGTGSARALSSGERTTLLAYLKTKAPAMLTATGGALRVLTTIEELQPIEITIQTNGDPAFDFDWNDSTAPVVLVWTSATRSMQFTANVPTTMVAGSRFVVRGVGSVQDGSVFTVESVSAADTIIVREQPPIDFAATDVIYAAGPLTDIIRDAIVGYTNGEIVYADTNQPVRASVAGTTAISRKLRRLVDGLGTSNPAGLYNGSGGAWSGTLQRGALDTISRYSAGVRNVTVVTPATDQESTDYPFPNDSQIGYIAPSSVLIRKG